MPAIALIDDRPPMRGTLRKQLQRELRQDAEWRVIDLGPFPELNEYPGWISEEEVAVILTDERLHEGIDDAGDTAASYEGHQLVDFLRERFPTLPIYVVTAYPPEGPLEDRFGAVEDVIQKDQLSDRPGEYVERFVRAGSKFLEENEEALARLNVLATRVAKGEDSDTDRQELDAIQSGLGMRFAGVPQSRAEWIAELEDHAAKMKALEERLREAIDEAGN